MSITVESNLLNGVMVLHIQRHHDNRGYFEEMYREQDLALLGIPRFVQTNHSRSNAGVVRGLHAQQPMGKLLYVVSGTIQLVELDIRPTSDTFGEHVTVTLADTDESAVWIPPGFANGFCILSEHADVVYQCTAKYNAADEIAINPMDPDLGISWLTSNPILSKRDAQATSWLQVRDRLLHDVH